MRRDEHLVMPWTGRNRPRPRPRQQAGETGGAKGQGLRPGPRGPAG